MLFLLKFLFTNKQNSRCVSITPLIVFQLTIKFQSQPSINVHTASSFLLCNFYTFLNSYAYLVFLLFVVTPDAPQGLDIMEQGRSSVELCWSKPIRDGGAPIDSYIIERSEGRYNIWTPVDEVSSLRFNYKITGLLEAYRYKFRVAAVNSAGIGHWATVKVSL